MKKISLLTILFVFAFLFETYSQTFSITFNVDMRVKTKESKFNKATDTVYARGNFNGWSTANRMLDTDGDTVYTVKIDTFKTGQTVSFKFFYTPSSWEGDPNRSITVGSSNITFKDWFDRDSVVTIIASGNILFQVDMSVMKEIAIFNQNTDSIQVRGSFNGWGDSEPLRSKLKPNALNPLLFELNCPFNNYGLNETQEYKFYVKLATPGLWTDGWERPNVTGGGNRKVAFLGQSNQQAGKVFFDDVHTDWVIASGTKTITFKVNMGPAMRTPTPLPFDKTKDTLYWICEKPSFVRSQNWADSDTMKYLKMTPVTPGDSIYQGTLTVTGPSFNTFMYRYAFVHFDATNQRSWVHEPAGFGWNNYRVRFIKQTAARTFVQPYTAPQDVWTNSDEKPGTQEGGPMAVEDNGIIASSFSLEQNYPNPFNPTTSIRFGITERGIATLKLFNTLGEEVALLVNDELNAGTYTVNFDASKLTSGVYFYTLTSGNYTATKKMLLLK